VLRVSPSVIEQIRVSAVLQANIRLEARARQRFPDIFKNRDMAQGMALIESVRKIAGHHQIENEDDIACSVDLVLMYGIDVFAQDWCADIFTLTQLNGVEKMALIRNRVRTQLPDFDKEPTCER
jgi:hypothetical protein